MYVKFIFWQKSSQRHITIFQQNMSKKLLRGSNPWDKLKAVCLGNFKGSLVLERRAQDRHKPHSHCLEGLLPSQKQLNKSWRGQQHNCQAQPCTEPSRKRQGRKTELPIKQNKATPTTTPRTHKMFFRDYLTLELHWAQGTQREQPHCWNFLESKAWEVLLYKVP